MNIYLCIIVAALLLNFLLHALSRFLDLNNQSLELPAEFKDYYSPDEYGRSLEYTKARGLVFDISDIESIPENAKKPKNSFSLP